ncbi:unnamed protein product [Urochloa humidicola]
MPPRSWTSSRRRSSGHRRPRRVAAARRPPRATAGAPAVVHLRSNPNKIPSPLDSKRAKFDFMAEELDSTPAELDLKMEERLRCGRRAVEEARARAEEDLRSSIQGACLCSTR